MASSTNTSPQKLAHQNSSLFGTLKNIVTAPLNWLAGAEHEDNLDSKGKRRRRHQPSIESANVDNGDRPPRSKRIRVYSPHDETRLPSYLDPPTSAFQLHQHPPLKRRTPVPLARSSLSAFNLDNPRNVKTNHSRSTLSPLRLSRTMSIDPPLRPLSREMSIQDVIMESVPFTLTSENSIPALPLSSRSSFRMRSSLTPQPQREVSEPPPLNSLVSNPTFVHAPPIQAEPQSTSTLGTLLDAVRSTRSPSRQHSSILFGSTKTESKDLRFKQVLAEKALRELDIYKTPLVPTRLRSANQPSLTATNSTPDMFKSRRASNLILMHDDRRSEKLEQKARTSKSPLTNNTKPYAGEGGMKKLLARRKQEVEVPLEEQYGRRSGDQDTVVDGSATSQYPPLQPLSALPSSSGWFAAATAGTPTAASGSSLRVGRAKSSRNHIARPSRHKFSAVFEDENDDSMDRDDEEARRKEREMIDEAVKNAPPFKISPSFTFAKPEPKSVEQDLTNAKEPPIPVLPFSFSKPVTAVEPSKNNSMTLAATSIPKANEGTKVSLPLAIVDPPTFHTEAPKDFLPRTITYDRVPNFFANSSVFTNAVELPAPLPFILPIAAPSTIPTSTSASTFSSQRASVVVPSIPATDGDNPFWDQDKEHKQEIRDAHQGLAKNTSATSNALSPAPSASESSLNGKLELTAGPAPGLSFVKPAEFALSHTPSSSNITEPSNSSMLLAQDVLSTDDSRETPQLPFGKDPRAMAPFEHKTSTSNGLFGTHEVRNSASISGEVIQKPLLPSSTEFSLRHRTATANELSRTATLATSADPPKATFLAEASYEFLAKSKDPGAALNRQSSTSPFSFSLVPRTPLTKADGTKSVAFNFGNSSRSAVDSATLPVSFSSSSDGTNAAGVSKPFTFGTPVSVIPTDRPVTPPKNNEQEFRMEESPTREMQQANGSNKARALGFSFGASNPIPIAPIFGTSIQQTTPLPTTTPFAFASSTNINPFAPTKNPMEADPFSFSMSNGTSTASSSPFAFGPSNSTGGSDVPRPSTADSFTFNTIATPASATGQPFSFGAPANVSNPFNQSQSGSAPSSPSTFNQPSPFSFTAPLPTSGAQFSFGSQPASPAGATTTLPGTGGFGAPTGAFGQAAPPSPFSTPGPLAASTSSGGTLFTIGAAPAPAPTTSGGPRQIRKLPNRRPGTKR